MKSLALNQMEACALHMLLSYNELRGSNRSVTVLLLWTHSYEVKNVCKLSMWMLHWSKQKFQPARPLVCKSNQGRREKRLTGGGAVHLPTTSVPNFADNVCPTIFGLLLAEIKENLRFQTLNRLEVFAGT